MGTFVGIVVAVVGLGFLILAHEFGHFIVAKLTGMRVEEFSLGFGPYLFSRRIGETVYGISAVPLGGYVRVTGMHKEDFFSYVAEAEEERERERYEAMSGDDEDGYAAPPPEDHVAREGRRPQDPEDKLAGARAISVQEIAATPLERRYYAHPFWHKFLFIIAGVTMNMIVAFLLFWVVSFTQGYAEIGMTLEHVEAGSPAAAAGLVPGDRILSVAGKDTSDWEVMRTEIALHPEESLVVVVERAGKPVELKATPKAREDGTGYLGIQPQMEHRDLGVVASFGQAGRYTSDTVVLIFKSIGWMFKGDVPVLGSQGLAGPVGIIQISNDAVAGGYYLYLLALISINLAILNMLPLLPLDGGHVVFSIVERLRGKSLSLRTFERISMVGLALFGMLFIVATGNDIGRLFGF